MTLEERLKNALGNAMHYSAAFANRCRALECCATALTDEQFSQAAGQSKSTLARDIQWADQDYEKCKSEYEAFCAEIGQPAYATYNED